MQAKMLHSVAQRGRGNRNSATPLGSVLGASMCSGGAIRDPRLIARILSGSSRKRNNRSPIRSIFSTSFVLFPFPNNPEKYRKHDGKRSIHVRGPCLVAKSGTSSLPLKEHNSTNHPDHKSETRAPQIKREASVHPHIQGNDKI